MSSLYSLLHTTWPCKVTTIGVHVDVGANNFAASPALRPFRAGRYYSHRWLRNISNGAGKGCGPCVCSAQDFCGQDSRMRVHEHHNPRVFSITLVCSDHPPYPGPHVLQLGWVTARSWDRGKATNRGSLLALSNSSLKHKLGREDETEKEVWWLPFKDPRFAQNQVSPNKKKGIMNVWNSAVSQECNH